MAILEKMLFWDWNGTLLDDAHTCLNTMNAMLRKRNMPELNLELYKEVFGFPVVNYYQKIGFDFTRESFEALSVEFIDAYNRALGSAPLAGKAKDVLEFFNREGKQQVIVSAMRQDMLLESVRNKGLEVYFTEILGIEDIYAASKSRMAKAWVEKQGLDAGDILFIGDTLHDFEVAEELGCRCLLVADGHQSEARLKHSGATVIRSLEDLLKDARCSDWTAD